MNREGRSRPDCQGSASCPAVNTQKNVGERKTRGDFVPQHHSEGMVITFIFSRLWRSIDLWVRGQSWLRTEVFPKENLSYHTVNKNGSAKYMDCMTRKVEYRGHAVAQSIYFNLISCTGGVLIITKAVTCGSGDWILDSSIQFSGTHHLKP